jgi:hypothetical protein
MPKAHTLTPAATLKQLCPLLDAIGVTRVEARYDGSGDSGDFDDIVFIFTDRIALQDMDARDIEPRGSRMYLDEFRRTHTTADPAIFTAAQLTTFVDTLWEFLPGGWEINEGSYGEITVDTRTTKVTLDHNERIVEINSSHEEW